MTEQLTLAERNRIAREAADQRDRADALATAVRVFLTDEDDRSLAQLGIALSVWGGTEI